MEFYSGKPDNLAASVRDYCTGVLKHICNIGFANKTLRNDAIMVGFSGAPIAD